MACTPVSEKQTLVRSAPVITPHTAAEASRPLIIWEAQKCRQGACAASQRHIRKRRPQGIPCGLLYHACFRQASRFSSASIRSDCERITAFRKCISSSSSSTRFFGASVSIMVCYALQGLSIGLPSMIVSAARQVIFLLPLAYVLGKVMGITGVWTAFPITEAVVMVGSCVYLKHILNRLSH